MPYAATLAFYSSAASLAILKQDSNLGPAFAWVSRRC